MKHILEDTEATQQLDGRLYMVYAAIHALQRRVFGETWPRDVDDMIAKYVKYIQVEAVEALQCTNFKDHKRKQPVDTDNLRDEIADLFIYVCAMSGCVFTSLDDFMSQIEQKVQKNETRKDWDINQ